MINKIYNDFCKDQKHSRGKVSFGMFIKFLTAVTLKDDFDEIDYKKGSILDKQYLDYISKMDSGILIDLAFEFSSYILEVGTDSAVDELISLYELGILQLGEKKKTGVFYTPVSIAEKIIKDKKIVGKYKSFYDPFCGAGSFLVAISKQSKGGDVELFGSDIDEVAVALCRLLVFFYSKRNLRDLVKVNTNIKVIDSLSSDSKETDKVKSICSRVEMIVTNPPYGFAITESQQKTVDVRVPDKEVFLFSIEKISSYGVLQNCFLVPETLMLNLGAKKYREYLSSKYKIEVKTFKDEALFSTATVDNITVDLFTAGKKNIVVDGKITESCKFIEGDSNKKELFANHILVSDLFEVSQGLIPYDKYRGHTENQIKNRVYHSEKKINSQYKPELKGRDLKPLTVEFNGDNWVKYGSWLAAPRNPKYFNGPRVLVREITRSEDGRITCSYCEQEFYFTPSIISIVPKEGLGLTKRHIMTLSILLSSSIYGKYHLETNPKARKGTFPKILVSDVRKLPLPDNFMSLDFSKEYIKMINKSLNGEEVEKTLKEIDGIVLRGTSRSKTAERAA